MSLVMIKSNHSTPPNRPIQPNLKTPKTFSNRQACVVVGHGFCIVCTALVFVPILQWELRPQQLECPMDQCMWSRQWVQQWNFHFSSEFHQIRFDNSTHAARRFFRRHRLGSWTASSCSFVAARTDETKHENDKSIDARLAIAYL